MEGQLYLSVKNGIAVVSGREMSIRCVPFSGAGMLCAGQKSIFCSDESGAIWRLDRKNLTEEALSCGGPGICDLCLSPAQDCLYSLLGEADSVLMSDVKSGRPMVVNRCGCNPKGLSISGDRLAVAGGESGCVHLYDSHTLEMIAELSMPGPVQSVLISPDALCALCRTPDLNSVLVIKRWRKQTHMHLSGAPGALYANGQEIFAATEGRVYVFSLETGCLLEVRAVPGRAGRICVSGGSVFVHDLLSGRVIYSREGAPWRVLAAEVNAMCQA